MPKDPIVEEMRRIKCTQEAGRAGGPQDSLMGNAALDRRERAC
jgi:hypothetical protein